MSRWCDRSIHDAGHSVKPNGPLRGRGFVWNPCRGNHLGQRSCASAPTGRTYGRKRSDQNTAKTPCEEGAVHIRRGPSTYGLRTPSPPPSHLLHGLIAAALPQTDRTQVSSQGGVPRLEPRTARTRTQRAARSRSDAAGSPTAALPLISLSTPLTRSCPLALPSAPTFAKRRRQMRSAPPIRPRRRQMSKRQQAPAPTLSLSCRWATGRPWRRVSRRG